MGHGLLAPRRARIAILGLFLGMAILVLFGPALREGQVRAENRFVQSKLKTLSVAITAYNEAVGEYPQDSLLDSAILRYARKLYKRNLTFSDPMNFDDRLFDVVPMEQAPTAVKDSLCTDPYGDILQFAVEPHCLILWSLGPDRQDDLRTALASNTATRARIVNHVYDPTNGTFSRGDIILVFPKHTNSVTGSLFREPTEGIR